MQRYLIIIFLIVIQINCGVRKSLHNNSDYIILNEVIKKDEVSYLYSKPFFYFKPDIFMDRYLKNKMSVANPKNDSLLTVLNGEVEWLFSENDIKFMKNKYVKWQEIPWNKTKINKKRMKLYDSEMLPNKTDSTLFVISRPMYDKLASKAMVIKLKHEGYKNTLVQILLFKKKDGGWTEVGSLFSGIY